VKRGIISDAPIWLPREDSNLGPSGYTCPDITTGSGLSLSRGHAKRDFTRAGV